MKFLRWVLPLWLAMTIPCWGATIHLLDDGSGKFRVVAEGLVDVASMDLTLEYDPDSLRIDEGTPGALLNGMLFASNTKQPGLVRIGSVGIRAIQGDGELALLSGALVQNPPVIKSFNATLRNESKQRLPVQTTLPIHLQESLTTEPSRTTMVQGSTGATTHREKPRSEQDTGESSQLVSSQNPVKDQLYGGAFLFDELQVYAATSPYRRMQAFRGKRTLEALSALFERPETGIRQYPYPAISDGHTEVAIVLPAQGEVLPGLGVSQATLVSSGVNDSGEWEIRILPNRGTLSATVLMARGKQLVEFPVVVVPASTSCYPPSASGELLRVDVNLDNQFTWEDDYICLGNYLTGARQTTP